MSNDNPNIVNPTYYSILDSVAATEGGPNDPPPHISRKMSLLSCILDTTAPRITDFSNNAEI